VKFCLGQSRKAVRPDRFSQDWRYARYQALPFGADSGNGVASRLAFALKANAFAALPLLVGMITVGNNRFLSEAIDPTLQKEDAATVVNGRVLDNTLQQYVAFLVGTLALSTTLDAGHMKVIAAAACVFIVARFAFWFGYRIHPLYRAFGMAATMYLNFGILAWAGWNILRE